MKCCGIGRIKYERTVALENLTEEINLPLAEDKLSFISYHSELGGGTKAALEHKLRGENHPVPITIQLTPRTIRAITRQEVKLILYHSTYTPVALRT